ncbi:MAG: copper oxidase [Kofleriaceae bacterium]|nr:copper oxidase [Kofleriaceae bacterium]
MPALSRRALLWQVGAASGAALLGSRVATAQPAHEMANMPGMDHSKSPSPPVAVPVTAPPASRRTTQPSPVSAPVARPVVGTIKTAKYQPVIGPNGRTLPFKLVDGVKVFHLIAQVVAHKFTDGLEVEAWGYNGGTPGPLIEAVEGDRIRVYVTNHLPEPTTVHWHGLFLPSGMDGVAGLTQKPIEPDDTHRYEFTLTKPGTFMYHPHFDEMIQIALGMVGMIVVHPKAPARETRRVRDYSWMIHEWKVDIGAKRPDPMAMNDFNVLTINSKCFPSTAPVLAEVGDLVRIRIGNLGPMDSHPIHLHGYAFEVVYTDGGPVPRTARWPETTVLVPVGACRVIEFVADTPGDWAIHCHMTHHVMNQMGHDVANVIGAKTDAVGRKINKQIPGYMVMGETGMGDMMEMKMPHNSISMRGGPGPFSNIDMGGMFTVVKVRQKLPANGADPGWFDNPAGTVATNATELELARDSIQTARKS